MFAVGRSTPAVISSNRCGRIFAWAKKPEVWTVHVLVGLLALAALVMHGWLWVQWKTSGPVCAKAARVAGATWAVVAVILLVTAVTFQVQPQVTENFTTWPRGTVFPLLALAGAAGVKFELARKTNEKRILPRAPI